MSNRKEMQQAIAQQALVQTMMIAEQAERQLDQAIDHFDNLSKDEIEKIRQKRKEQLKDRMRMMEVRAFHSCIIVWRLCVHSAV